MHCTATCVVKDPQFPILFQNSGDALGDRCPDLLSSLNGRQHLQNQSHPPFWYAYDAGLDQVA